MHFRLSEADEPSSLQSSPPNFGAGLLHARVRSWSAPPQLTGHVSHSVQFPHPPFTRIFMKYLTYQIANAGSNIPQIWSIHYIIIYLDKVFFHPYLHNVTVNNNEPYCLHIFFLGTYLENFWDISLYHLCYYSKSILLLCDYSTNHRSISSHHLLQSALTKCMLNLVR